MPRLMAIYKGKRVEKEAKEEEAKAEAERRKKTKKPFFTVYGAPFKVVEDEVDVLPQDGKYKFDGKSKVMTSTGDKWSTYD